MPPPLFTRPRQNGLSEFFYYKEQNRRFFIICFRSIFNVFSFNIHALGRQVIKCTKSDNSCTVFTQAEQAIYLLDFQKQTTQMSISTAQATFDTTRQMTLKNQAVLNNPGIAEWVQTKQFSIVILKEIQRFAALSTPVRFMSKD